MSRTPISIEGNVSSDVRVHTFNDGSRVANFTVADNSSKKNEQAGTWEDVGAQFYECSVRGILVDAAVNNLRKGVPVIVIGTLDYRAWQSEDKTKSGVALQVSVDKLGHSLRFHDVSAGKRQHGGGGGGPQGSAASHYGQPQTANQGYAPQGAPQTAAQAYAPQPGQQPPQYQQQAAPPQQQAPQQQSGPQAQAAWGQPAIPQQQASPGSPWLNPGANFDDTEAPF